MSLLEGRMNRREALQLGAGAFLAVHNVGSVSEVLGNLNHIPSISSGAELGFQKSPVSDLICTSRSILKARNRVLQGDGESDILSVSDQLPYGNTGDTISIRLSEILKDEAEDFQVFTYGLHSGELGGSVLFFTNTIDLQLSRLNDFYESVDDEILLRDKRSVLQHRYDKVVEQDIDPRILTSSLLEARQYGTTSFGNSYLTRGLKVKELEYEHARTIFELLSEATEAHSSDSHVEVEFDLESIEGIHSASGLIKAVSFTAIESGEFEEPVFSLSESETIAIFDGTVDPALAMADGLTIPELSIIPSSESVETSTFQYDEGDINSESESLHEGEVSIFLEDNLENVPENDAPPEPFKFPRRFWWKNSK